MTVENDYVVPTQDDNESPKGEASYEGYKRDGKYWSTEVAAAEKRVEKWHKTSDKIVNRFRADESNKNVTTARLNLFYSNVETLQSMLYGSVPKIDVSRRYADASDDVSRVAAEVMQRMLNEDIQVNGKEIDSVLRSALQDRLLSGLGVAKLRYTFDEQPDEVGVMQATNEKVPIDYYYWGDVLWGWARNFANIPWISFRNFMSKEDAAKRFGEEIAETLEYNVRTSNVSDETPESDDDKSELKQAEILEIWCKASGKVYWFSKHTKKLLEEKDDPLELKGFFPCPPFLLANPTTKLYMPTPDFKMAEDLYNEIDLLQTRISKLTEAVKAVGVYDKASDGVQRMFKEGSDNTLIPVDSWAAFSEKGGIKGAIDWMPIDAITNAIDRLTGLRNDSISLLQQITGMADVMRGELQNQYEGVGQTKQKAKFGSVRVQALQQQFAQFASDIMEIKAEIIGRFFSPETIMRNSNMMTSFDKETLPQAIKLIKNPELSNLSIVIRPESVAMIDYGEMRAERMEYLDGLSRFMGAVTPMIQQRPEAEPFILQLMQWGLAGFKGSQQIESLLDRTIEASQKEQENPNKEPSPEQRAQQAQQAQQQAQQQAEMQKIQAKAQADMQVRQQDMQADIETANQVHLFKMKEIEASALAKQIESDGKHQQRIGEQVNDAEANIAQSNAAAEADMAKTEVKTEAKLTELVAKAELEAAQRTDEYNKSRNAKVEDNDD
jgi:hypothetical protein